MWVVFSHKRRFLIEAIYITGYSAKATSQRDKKNRSRRRRNSGLKHFSNAAMAIEELKTKGYRVLAVEQVENSLKLHHLNRNGEEKIAVIFGNEVVGVEQATIALCDGCLEIPQLGMKHSLNIANCSGSGIVGNGTKPDLAPQ